MLNKIKEVFNDLLKSKIEKIPKIYNSFSSTEKVFFYIFTIIFSFSFIFLYKNINEKFLVEIPIQGGSIVEGVIGSPRFINPILATSKADEDLSILIYSGLLKATPSGKLIPDLAESYEISEDRYVYTFKLKDDLKFHDGEKLTTKDIEFTINATQNNIIKSPKRANWDGVEIKRLNDKEIQFILPQPYSPFLENLSLGILPEHIWGEISPEQFVFSQFNIEPVGSGPYEIKKIKRNSSETLESYSLKSFNDYALGEPFVTELIIKLYANEEALINAFNNNSVQNINSINPNEIKNLELGSSDEILSTPLPRIFGVFFNQNENPVFTNEEVRIALNRAINRKQIINDVLYNYGVSIDSPIPSNSMFYIPNSDEADKGMDSAKEILKEHGWSLNDDGILEKITNKETSLLSFSISTANTPELKATAELLKLKWEELGAQVQLKIYEIGDLNQNVIRPRDYDSILFGKVIGRDMDLFAFWHSSQRNDPGLNISMYTNITVDNLLEEIRIINNVDEQKIKFEKLQEEIFNDVPAIFIYSPHFIYINSTKIKNNPLNQITIPSQRFLDINNWYIKTDKIWKLFL
ncbi:MAG: hypothetical protein KAS02_01815 [Candidatus Pacebacteria bacterium]|nr:hypothetical protein [Candidatus Paceibacterota bacterium]